jgi:hypothetical protein
MVEIGDRDARVLAQEHKQFATGPINLHNRYVTSTKSLGRIVRMTDEFHERQGQPGKDTCAVSR